MQKYLFPIFLTISAHTAEVAEKGKDAWNIDQINPSFYRPQVQSDRDVERRIQEALISDPYLSSLAKNLVITSTYGIVRLQGTVLNSLERDKVESIANQIAGVKGIDNQLQVVTQHSKIV